MAMLEARCLRCNVDHPGWSPCCPREPPHVQRATQEEVRALVRRHEWRRLEVEALLERAAAEQEARRRAVAEALWREEMVRIRAANAHASASALDAARRRHEADQEEARRQRRLQAMARRVGVTHEG